MSVTISLKKSDGTIAEGKFNSFEDLGKERRNPSLREEIDQAGIRFGIVHTSGHAYVKDLKKFCDAIKPKLIVPIHTFHGGEYERIFKYFKVQPLNDNEEFIIGNNVRCEESA